MLLSQFLAARNSIAQERSLGIVHLEPKECLRPLLTRKRSQEVEATEVPAVEDTVQLVAEETLEEVTPVAETLEEATLEVATLEVETPVEPLGQRADLTNSNV